MGTTVPAQMFDHELNAVKGWPSPYGLDKSGPIAAGQSGILKGMCVSLDVNGNFIRGCPNGSMPIFAFPNQSDFDVDSDVGNISGGHLMGLVAAGSFELQTTEFVGAGFAPNVPLTSEQSVALDIGRLKVTTLNSTDMIVGVVSAVGPFKNEFGKQFLQFWPVYMPKRV